MIFPFSGIYPTIHPSAFITDNVSIIGDVTIDENASLWFGVVVRGDVNSIHIGARTSVQDNSMLHVTWKKFKLDIGADVTIGHSAVLHGCTIHDRVLVGMGAVILDGAVVNSDSLIAAGTLVREGFVVPPGSLVAGVPGKVVRMLSDAEKEAIGRSSKNYQHYVDEFRKHGDLDRGVSVEQYFAMKKEGRI
jgi:carbonic anhydrase/acetyltransferase-like protein (isoleucine patch superfamily)